MSCYVKYSIIWNTKSMVMKQFHKVSLSGLSMNRHPCVDWKLFFSVSGMPLFASSFFVLGKAVVLKELNHYQVSCSRSKSQLRFYVCAMLSHTDKLKQNWRHGIIHGTLIEITLKLRLAISLQLRRE